MGFGIQSLNKSSLGNYQIAISRFDGENSTADFFVRGGSSSFGNSNTILNIPETDRQQLNVLFHMILQEKKGDKQLSISDILSALEEILRKLSQPDYTMPKEIRKNDLANIFNGNSTSYPDYVPINSPLGQTLSRPQMDCRPVDSMYKPVYGKDIMGQRKVVGYKRISEQEKRTMFYA